MFLLYMTGMFNARFTIKNNIVGQEVSQRAKAHTYHAQD